MKFLKIQANNFMQFKELGIDLSNKGLCLISGEIEGETFSDSNTAGKTTAVVHTIMWCLFGETLTELKGDDVINEAEDKNCFVKTLVENNSIYSIIRYRKHKKYKNELKLFLGDIDPNNLPIEGDLTKSSNGETQEEINKLFNLSWNIFTNTILFGQGNIKRFSELGDSDRKKLLDDILNLSILQEFQNKVKVQAKDKLTDISDIKKSIDNNWMKHAQFDGLIKSVESSDAVFEANKKNKLITLNDSINSLTNKIEDIKNNSINIENTNKNIDKLKEVLLIIEEHEESLLILNDNINKTKLKIKENTVELNNINKNIAINSSKINNIENDLREDCDSCGSAITDSGKNKFKEQFKKEISILELNKSKFSNNELEKKLELLTNKYTIVKTKISKKNDITNAIHELKNQIASYNNNSKLIDNLNISIVDKLSQIDSIEKETNTSLKFKEDYSKKLTMIVDENKELSSTVDLLTIELEYLKFWEIGFSNSGIKSFMLDTIVPILTEKTNYYLDYLTNGEIKILFDTQSTLKNSEDKRDKLDIKLFKNGKEYCFKKTSGGEKRRIDICISLALQSLNANSFNTNITVFDEAFDSLDETGVDCVINLLNEEIKYKDSIFVISHDSNLKDKFKNVLTIRKICGTSNIQ